MGHALGLKTLLVPRSLHKHVWIWYMWYDHNWSNICFIPHGSEGPRAWSQELGAQRPWKSNTGTALVKFYHIMRAQLMEPPKLKNLFLWKHIPSKICLVPLKIHMLGGQDPEQIMSAENPKGQFKKAYELLNLWTRHRETYRSSNIGW